MAFVAGGAVAAASARASVRHDVCGGPLRRAHPASGATWNVQVVRGKITTGCLWHACRALFAGLLLMLLGAAMATIGYYADELSVWQEVRGNATIRMKNESRGFHLNNLSYAGPIVMGVGGFIVMSACVITFEARDSAAKVTPARPTRSCGATGAGTGSGAAVTASDARQRQHHSHRSHHSHHHHHTHKHHRHSKGPKGDRSHSIPVTLRRSESAPDLCSGIGASKPAVAPSGFRAQAPFSTCAYRSRAVRFRDCRHALSVDGATGQPSFSVSGGSSACGSQSSLALELHSQRNYPAPVTHGAAPVTLRVRDRSATSRRHTLSRQRHIHVDERGMSNGDARRSSVASGSSNASRVQQSAPQEELRESLELLQNDEKIDTDDLKQNINKDISAQIIDDGVDVKVDMDTESNANEYDVVSNSKTTNATLVVSIENEKNANSVIEKHKENFNESDQITDNNSIPKVDLTVNISTSKEFNPDDMDIDVD